MKAVSVALPSVCHHDSSLAIFGASSARRSPATSIRSSSHRKASSMVSGLHALRNSQAEVPVVHVHRAVADLHLEVIKRARRRAGDDLPRLHVELPAATRTEESLSLPVVE